MHNNIVTIKSSFRESSLILLVEISSYNDLEVPLSLFEDIKKKFIKRCCPVYSTSNPKIPAVPIITYEEPAELVLTLPATLHNKLKNRAHSEKTNIHTLCVYYLSKNFY